MSDQRSKELISLGSFMAAELLTFPISSTLTKVQSNFVNQSALQKSYSSYAGGYSIFMSLPGFLFRIKLSNILDPYLKEKYSFSQLTTYALVSCLADFVNVILRCPAEHYKQQFQTGNYTSFNKFYREYLGYMGPLSFWRGGTLFFLRDSSFNLLRFILIESLTKKAIEDRKKSRNIYRVPRSQSEELSENYQLYTWCNVLATIPVAILTTPLDFLKTRIMTNPAHNHQSVLGMVKEIIKEEGILTLFRGAGLRAFYVCSLISIFTSIELSLRIPLMEATKVHKELKYKEDLFS